MEFEVKGLKQKDSHRYDRVTVISENGKNIIIHCYDGYMLSGNTALVTPATAREIAAALIEAADKAEGKE